MIFSQMKNVKPTRVTKQYSALVSERITYQVEIEINVNKFHLTVLRPGKDLALLPGRQIQNGFLLPVLLYLL